VKIISKPKTAAKSAKAQKVEKAIIAVSEVTNLPPARIVGVMSLIPEYSTARMLLVQLFMDDCQINRHSIQRFFKFSAVASVQNSYNKGKIRRQEEPQFNAMLKTARESLNKK
jgi:hypothetical protein